MKNRGVKLYWGGKELEGDERGRALYWLGYGLLIGLCMGMIAGIFWCFAWNYVVFG